MKKTIAMLLVLFVSSMGIFANGQNEAASGELKVAAEAYFGEYPGSRIIPADKVFENIDAGHEFLILDIRKAADYEKGHLKGAVNAPWGPALAEAINWLPDDMPIYVGCYSGQTAGQATAVLNVAGFQASSIKYGWNLGVSKTEGYENYVETTANMAPEASGVKIDAEIEAAAKAYFNIIPEAGSNIIPAAKVKAMIDNDEAPVVVSIRKAEDYAKGHIEGALNIPFGKGMQENFSQLPMDEKVYVYCYSGQTAGQTVAILRLLGYDAISIKSGMGTSGTGSTGWANEGFPTM